MLNTISLIMAVIIYALFFMLTKMKFIWQIGRQ